MKNIKWLTLFSTLLVSLNMLAADPKVSSITLDKSTASISAQDRLRLIPTVTTNPTGSQYTLTWSSDDTSIATVDASGLVTGVAVGTANISCKAAIGSSNKTAKCKVTVLSPKTDSETGVNHTIHEPGVYEDSKGYATKMVVSNSREYEVFYINRDANEDLSVATSNADKAGSITNGGSKQDAEAKDRWLKINTASNFGGDKNASKKDEFESSIYKISMKDGDAITMRVKGYDQFSLYAKDNGDAPKCLTVYINGQKQPMTTANSYTIRRFDSTNSSFTSGDNFIKIIATSTSTSSIVAFSLRVAQEPKVKYMKGNDSTQTVLATTAMNPVYYYVKYNRIQGAQTQLVWEGDSASGITLTPRQSAAGAIGDTLVLGGSANCAAGTYRYRVVGSLNGVETSSVSGKFNVYNKITAMTVVDTINAYTNEEMDAVNFRYYTAAQDSWSCAFLPAQPNGITLSKKSDGVLVMQGTPTQKGEYDFRVWVTGDTVSGHLSIQELDMSNNPVLYLYKERNAFKHNGVYTYLKEEKNMNLIARVAKEDGLRQIDSRYKWILISEDVDADNAEVLAIARGDANLPVLNMKGFSYTEGRLDWGEPNNGTLDSVNDHRYKIFVQRADHPIFNGWNQGDSIQILNRIDRRGVMPIAVDLENTLCLATAYTRGKNYYEDGELQTILHEIPAAMRKGKKYLCLPIAQSSSQYLTEDGKKLISAAVNYLTNDQGTVALPKLEITDFAIGNEHAEIDQMNNTISLELDAQTYPDLAKLRPAVKLAAPTFTFIATPVTDTVNFESSYFAPIEYIVSDYINRRVYEVTITHNQLQSIDNVYTDGEWVNVYDIYGRLIVTTNENIYTMSLPRGMYLIVTASGQTIKLMK